MTITFTLGTWHFVIAGILLYILFIFIFGGSCNWRLQKAYYYMAKPIIWVSIPFIAVFYFFRHMLVAYPVERFEDLRRRNPTRNTNRIQLLPFLWLWIDSDASWWGKKVFLVRTKN